ncbi:aspartyl-phosphate phosphatase Spo0E family protein [Clostridium psychrophilum]|uniref:aspartyl-phosphate phosphatase Spo0E family protein n=1 Tax=Clostridium psychrophilum TaxID=132926 RepID=UPI001FE4ECC2|nr:aspartyl-phosphate phosphatase Spo0E family protein [Clostridium psychrophilum]
MNIKLRIIKILLESLRSILHFLLNFKKPTDRIVIFCSQQLDKVIVKYHKAKYTSGKVALTNNKALLNNNLSPLLKSLASQYTISDKALNLHKKCYCKSDNIRI